MKKDVHVNLLLVQDGYEDENVDSVQELNNREKEDGDDDEDEFVSKTHYV